MTTTTATKDEWTDILYAIYQACKDIPGWLEAIGPDFESDDIAYFERLVKMEEN